MTGKYISIIETEVIALDEGLISLIDNEEINCIVKIDADGEDTNVMRGMRELSRKCVLLVVEAPTRKPLERIRLMGEMGFEISSITSPSGCYIWLPEVDLFIVGSANKSRNVDLSLWPKSKSLCLGGNGVISTDILPTLDSSLLFPCHSLNQPKIQSLTS